jgi:hypothetical protein
VHRALRIQPEQSAQAPIGLRAGTERQECTMMILPESRK